MIFFIKKKNHLKHFTVHAKTKYKVHCTREVKIPNERTFRTEDVSESTVTKMTKALLSTAECLRDLEETLSMEYRSR